MKTFIITTLAAFILTSASAFARSTGKANRSAVAAINHTLDLYTNAVSKGQVACIDQLFSEQFHQRYTGAKKSPVFNKPQLVGFLKNHKNVQEQCETSYSIVDESKGTAIAKVAMKYKDFTRIDYVTIAQNGDSYQISQIISTFE